MKKRGGSNAIVRGLIPAALMLVVTVTLLAIFMSVGLKKSRTQVENLMQSQLKAAAQAVDREIFGVQRNAENVAKCLEKVAPTDTETVYRVARAAAELQGVYEVLLCNPDGTAVRLGEEVQETDVSDCSYLINYFTGEEKFLYLPHDEDRAENFFVTINPVNYVTADVTQYLITYYDVASITQLSQRTVFTADTFLIVLDEDGRTVTVAGNTGNALCEKTDDYFAHLESKLEDKNSVDKLRVRVKSQLAGICYLTYGGEERIMVVVPLDQQGFSLLACLRVSYVNRAVNNNWSFNRVMIWLTGIVIGLFSLCFIFLNIQEVMRFRKGRKELVDKADTDQLTGLYNKIATESKIKNYMAEHPNEQGLLFILDIDNFKKINDTMGHAFGDEVLRTLGTKIRNEFRSSDIIGRTGGDEFTIFLCNMRDDAIIKAEAEKVEQFFKGFKAGEYVKYAATASIGAAVFPRDGKSFETLYKASDQALYVAKKRGKNQLAFYGDDN